MPILAKCLYQLAPEKGNLLSCPGCLSPSLQHQYPKLLLTPLSRKTAQSAVSTELLLKQIKAVRSSCNILLGRQDDKGRIKL